MLNMQLCDYIVVVAAVSQKTSESLNTPTQSIAIFMTNEPVIPQYNTAKKVNFYNCISCINVLLVQCVISNFLLNIPILLTNSLYRFYSDLKQLPIHLLNFS